MSDQLGRRGGLVWRGRSPVHWGGGSDLEGGLTQRGVVGGGVPHDEDENEDDNDKDMLLHEAIPAYSRTWPKQVHSV